MTDPRMTPTNDAPVTVEQLAERAKTIPWFTGEASRWVQDALAALASAPAPSLDSLATAKARLSIAAVRARNSGQDRIGVHPDDIAVLLAAHSDLDRAASAPAGDGVGSIDRIVPALREIMTYVNRGHIEGDCSFCVAAIEEGEQALAAYDAALARPHSAVAPAGDGVEAFEAAATEAERIGTRWAEDTEHPATSRAVGKAIAASIRALTKMPSASGSMIAALQAQEDAEDARDDCECEGQGPWEHCGPCSARFGRAIDLRRAALANPRAAVGEQWVPLIGERVEVTDGVPDAWIWQQTALWVAGVRIHDSGDGFDVTVSEQWPIPARVSGRYLGQTDDFRVGASSVADMLRPLALQSPPAKVEG